MIDNPRDRGPSILFGAVVFMCCLLFAVAPAYGQLHVGPVYTNSDPNSDAPFLASRSLSRLQRRSKRRCSPQIFP
jgi:hypothetical protein